MAPPPNVVDKALYSKIHERIRKKLDSEGRQWGALTSAQLVNEFKRAGGRFKGSRNAQKEGLTKWFGEKWIDICALPRIKECGRANAARLSRAEMRRSFPTCRPMRTRGNSKTAAMISPATRARICSAKRRDPSRTNRFGGGTSFHNMPLPRAQEHTPRVSKLMLAVGFLSILTVLVITSMNVLGAHTVTNTGRTVDDAVRAAHAGVTNFSASDAVDSQLSNDQFHRATDYIDSHHNRGLANLLDPRFDYYALQALGHTNHGLHALQHGDVSLAQAQEAVRPTT